MRHSILRWLVLAFAFIALLTALMAFGWSFYNNQKQVISSCEESAVSCFEQIRYLLSDELLDALKEPGKSEHKDFHPYCPYFQNLCDAQGMAFLYVYQIDVETGKRYYLMAVQRDDSDEMLLELLTELTDQETATPLDDMELSAWAGDESTHQMVLKNLFGFTISWLVPFKAPDGKVLALIGAEREIALLRTQVIHQAIQVAGPILVVLLLAFLLLLVLTSNRIIRPIRLISERMNSFMADRSSPPEPLNIHSNDEVGDIAASFEKMSDDIRVYLRDIEKMTQERTAIEVEASVARRIQYGLVPEQTSLDGEGYQIRAMTRPARAVGGDFYDCFKRSDGKICLFLGDVSGKGVSAALFMAMARTMLHDLLKSGLSPEAALEQTNEELCRTNPEGLFATVFAAVLDLDSGELHFANAGHNYPLLLGDDAAYLQPETGTPLGLFDDTTFTGERLTLAPKQLLLLYTDGVTEAASADDRFFGEDRLLETLRTAPRSADDPAGTVIAAVRGAVENFTVGCEPFDDMAMLALFYAGSSKK